MNELIRTNNLIKSDKELLNFKNKNLRFSISSRNIMPHYSIHDYLKAFYPFINIEQVESIFGSSFIPSPLYGGRPYNSKHSIHENHEKELAELGIHISLTLTSHFFSPELYEQTLPLLERYHNSNNSIICTNDELAMQIRKDFPEYKLKASLIKNIKSLKRVEEAYKLYDYVVIPMEQNDDDRFLMSIPQKERVMLFGNASCAYNCKSRMCYKGISEYNRDGKDTMQCARKGNTEELGNSHVYFDVKKFSEMGFSFIKIIPCINSNIKNNLKLLLERNYKKQLDIAAKNAIHIVSFPKSGRTWLRFMLSNYFNLYFGINEEISLKNMFEFMPNDNYAEEMKGYYNYRFKNRKDIPLVLFSHFNQNYDLYENSRLIFLTRNPIDTIVSYYFHMRSNSDYQGSISEFIRDKKYGIKKVLNFNKNWEGKLEENQLHISYEEMHNDTNEILRKVIRYIGLAINDAYVSKAVALSRFSIMQKGEESIQVPGHKKTDNEEDRRVRQGKIGNYKKYLNEADIAFCMNLIKA